MHSLHDSQMRGRPKRPQPGFSVVPTHMHGSAKCHLPSRVTNIKSFHHTRAFPSAMLVIFSLVLRCICQLCFAGEVQRWVRAGLICSHDYLSQKKSHISPLFVSYMRFGFSHLVSQALVRMLITLCLCQRILSAVRLFFIDQTSWMIKIIKDTICRKG